MIVDLTSPSLDGRFILKLFDRRFAAQLRKEEGMGPWNTQLDSEYRALVQSGGATKKWEIQNKLHWRDHPSEWDGEHDEEGEDWTDAEIECYMQYRARRTYNIEKKAYEQMSDIQGKHVPQVFALPVLLSSISNEVNGVGHQSTDEAHGAAVDTRAVNRRRASLTSGIEPSTRDLKELSECPGILIEYIEGLTLGDLLEDNTLVPRAELQAIGDAAVQVIGLIRDRGVCNRDTNVRHCFIRKDAVTGQWQAIMTDFGLCFFRSQATNDEEFREWHADEDAEGAIGRVFERGMNGGFEYHESDYAYKLGNDFRRVHEDWKFCRCKTCGDWRVYMARRKAEEKAAVEKIAKEQEDLATKEKAEAQARIVTLTLVSLGALFLFGAWRKLASSRK